MCGVTLPAPRRAGSFTGPRNLGGVLFSVLPQLRYPPTIKKITRTTPNTIMIQSRSVLVSLSFVGLLFWGIGLTVVSFIRTPLIIQ
jgi:hypothetical protein